MKKKKKKISKSAQRANYKNSKSSFAILKRIVGSGNNKATGKDLKIINENSYYHQVIKPAWDNNMAMAGIKDGSKLIESFVGYASGTVRDYKDGNRYTFKNGVLIGIDIDTNKVVVAYHYHDMTPVKALIGQDIDDVWDDEETIKALKGNGDSVLYGKKIDKRFTRGKKEKVFFNGMILDPDVQIKLMNNYSQQIEDIIMKGVVAIEAIKLGKPRTRGKQKSPKVDAIQKYQEMLERRKAERATLREFKHRLKGDFDPTKEAERKAKRAEKAKAWRAEWKEFAEKKERKQYDVSNRPKKLSNVQKSKIREIQKKTNEEVREVIKKQSTKGAKVSRLPVDHSIFYDTKEVAGIGRPPKKAKDIKIKKKAKFKLKKTKKSNTKA